MNARITPEEQTLAVLTQAAGLGLVIDETLDGPTVYEVYWDMAEEPSFGTRMLPSHSTGSGAS